MKTRLLFLTTLFSFAINAQIDFEKHVTVDDTGGTNNPQSVFAADLDGDGDMDMLSASSFDNKIAWYKNLDGQGNFGPQQIISESYTGSASVFAADVDNDGNMDVLAAAGAKLLWFKNTDGLGNFGNAQEISAEIGAISIFAADFDNDGDMDVLGASYINNNIFWFENENGLGSFGPQQIIDSNIEYPFGTKAADIDGDGDMDILVAAGYNGNKVVWYKNTNGEGNFVPQQELTTDVQNPQDAIAADIDGDGDLDIIVSSRINLFRVLWFENTDGLGNFSNTPNLIASAPIFSPTKLLAADFDNDNDLDIVVGNDYNIGAVWYKNNGNGTFGNQLSIDSEIENITSLGAADIDNDGDADLLLTSGTADRVAWYENTTGQGSFGPANELAAINGANGPYQVRSTDIDGDGDKDIIAALYKDNRVVWQENLNGQGNFSELKELGSLKRAIAVYSGDVDGDGKMDVLASGHEKLIWYRNVDGQGSFGPEQLIDYQQYSDMETVHAADIDGDGDLDVFGHLSSNILFWKENNGTGGFGPRQIISQQYVLSDSIVTADMDNDGDLDLVVCYWGDGVIVWYENMDGQGSFSTDKLVDTLLAPDQVDVADFDNDGDMDIVTLDYGTDEVMWYENMDGQGTFGSKQVISNSVDRAFSLKATDIDADGDMDVLATSYSTATLWLFQNQGNGNFNNGQPFASEVRSPIFVTADDFNGDGKMDVLAPSYSNDEIIWFDNRGPLGIEENNANLFSIYPNPTNGLLIINSASTVSEISVYNNLGQLLFTSKEKNQIDISTLSQGIYFAKIKGENGQTETKKVVKK